MECEMQKMKRTWRTWASWVRTNEIHCFQNVQWTHHGYGMDMAPMLNGFIKSQTSLPKSDLFFNNEEYLKMFITATPAKELLIPGYNYFSMLQNFINRHFEIGEK